VDDAACTSSFDTFSVIGRYNKVMLLYQEGEDEIVYRDDI
jgi:hypothetical protein